MNSRAWYARGLIAVHDAISMRLRTSRTMTRFLFGVSPTHKPEHESWDYSTIVLRHALGRVLRPGMRILEVGVGEHALLSIAATRAVRDVDVTGIELSPGIAARARITAEAHGARIRILEGDVFAGDWGRYDLAFWNLPYVPRRAQANRIVRELGDPAWDGGTDGAEVLRRFLDLGPRILEPSGSLLLGINDFYLPPSALTPLARAAGFRLALAVRIPLNPSTAYLLSRADAGSGRGAPQSDFSSTNDSMTSASNPEAP